MKRVKRDTYLQGCTAVYFILFLQLWWFIVFLQPDSWSAWFYFTKKCVSLLDISCP